MYRMTELKSKHKNKLSEVLPEGELYMLSHALNLSRGGKLVSLEHEKDDKLLKIFDDLSHHTGNFYYGRYDLKCTTVEDLKQGKNFSILEYNGSGAEPHHVYGNGYNIFQACGILVSHWRMLYLIARTNHKNGVQYWGFRSGWRFIRNASKNIEALKQLDQETGLA